MPAAVSSERKALENQVIFEAASKGATLAQIAAMLVALGYGARTEDAIRQSQVYQEGRTASGLKKKNRPYAAEEIALIRDGAAQGLSAKKIGVRLAERGYVRHVSVIRASKPYADGRTLRLATPPEAPKPARAAPDAIAADDRGAEPVARLPRLAVRNPAFPGVSLPAVPMHGAGWETFAR